jgi:ribose 1,5-bisphosphokinase
MKPLPNIADRDRKRRLGGMFIGVLGPSGSGKDTLITLARQALATEPGFIFPRRLVTRPASPWEDHDTLTFEAFERGIKDDLFALYWRAHGLGYALARSALRPLEEGAIAVCNISRTSVPAARKTFAAVKIVLVTAPEEVLAERLAKRGRDDAADVSERLSRNEILLTDLAPDLTIVNAGPIESASTEFIGFLRACAL